VIIAGALTLLFLIWTLTLPSYDARIPLKAGTMKSQIDIDSSGQLDPATIFKSWSPLPVEAPPTSDPTPEESTTTSTPKKKLPAPAQLVTLPMDSDDIQKMDQLDPQLWEHIKFNHIIPPSNLPFRYPYDIPTNKPLEFIDKPVDMIIQDIFMNMVSSGIWSIAVDLERLTIKILISELFYF